MMAALDAAVYTPAVGILAGRVRAARKQEQHARKGVVLETALASLGNINSKVRGCCW